LLRLASQQGPETAFASLQHLQFYSLQMRATRGAAWDLASKPDSALAFCATLAQHINTRSLLPFAQTGSGARALLALNRPGQGEDKQPLQLYLGPFPLNPLSSDSAGLWSRFGGQRQFREESGSSAWLLPFQEIRQRKLTKRLDYSLVQLEECAGFALVAEVRQLFSALRGFADVGNVGALMAICPDSIPLLGSDGRGQTRQTAGKQEIANPLTPGLLSPGDSAPLPWLMDGWQMLERLQSALTGMEEYRQLTSPEARRDFLTLEIKRLRELSTDGFPIFWQGIAREIIGQWITTLEDEAKQAREWLRLVVRLPEQHPTIGTTGLLLEIGNESGVVARDIRLRLADGQGLHWAAATLNHRLLEGGQSVGLSVNMNCDQAGSYPLSGTIEARDLEGMPFRDGFSFRLSVGEAGAPYVLPDIEPYQVGEGLGSDDTFVGRH